MTYLCSARRYHVQGVDIEYSGACGFYPVNKNGDMYQRCTKHVNNIFDYFMSLSDDEKESYRTGGGCMALNDADTV